VRDRPGRDGRRTGRGRRPSGRPGVPPGRASRPERTRRSPQPRGSGQAASDKPIASAARGRSVPLPHHGTPSPDRRATEIVNTQQTQEIGICGLWRPRSADCEYNEPPRRQGFADSIHARGIGPAIHSLAAWRLGGSTTPASLDLKSARSAAFPNAIARPANLRALAFPVRHHLVWRLTHDAPSAGRFSRCPSPAPGGAQHHGR